METLLTALGGTPPRYWTVGALAGATLLFAAWDVRRIRPWMYLLALAICLFAFRWPIALYNGELGIDEGQVVAAAQKLVSHPIAWKHVDINTAGPLNAYAVTVLGWLGLPVNFLVAHVVALIFLWSALAGGYMLLRETGQERVARCAILPAVAFFSLTRFFDFVHYTSEHLSLALLGFGGAAAWHGVTRGRVWPTFLGMVALGAIPWAKLQGAPMALWISLSTGVVIARTARREGKLPWKLASAWLAGGLFATAGFALLLVIWNLTRQWHISYILQATVYMDAAGKSIGQTMVEFLNARGAVPDFVAFLWPLGVLMLMLLGALLFAGRAPHAPLLLFLAGNAIVSLYAVMAPGRAFFHYLLFLIMPATLLSGVLLSSALHARHAAESRPTSPWFTPVTLAAFLALTLIPQVVAGVQQGHWLIPYAAGRIERQQCSAARILARAAQPGDMLSVWGWMPRLYVESGLPQATRDGQTERQIVDGALREFYRNRYLHDLKRYRPRFFVEAVGPGQFAFTDRNSSGFATWPELREFIEANYTQFGEADSCRLYMTRTPVDGTDSSAR